MSGLNRFFYESFDSYAAASLETCVREYYLHAEQAMVIYADNSTNKCWFGNPSTSSGYMSPSGSSWTVHIKQSIRNISLIVLCLIIFFLQCLWHLWPMAYSQMFKSPIQIWWQALGTCMSIEHMKEFMSTRVHALLCVQLTTPTKMAIIVNLRSLNQTFVTLGPSRVKQISLLLQTVQISI